MDAAKAVIGLAWPANAGFCTVGQNTWRRWQAMESSGWFATRLLVDAQRQFFLRAYPHSWGRTGIVRSLKSVVFREDARDYYYSSISGLLPDDGFMSFRWLTGGWIYICCLVVGDEEESYMCRWT